MFNPIYFDMAYNNANGALEEYHMISVIRCDDKANADGEVFCQISTISWMPEFSRGFNSFSVSAYVPAAALTDADACDAFVYEECDEKGFGVMGCESLAAVVAENNYDFQMAQLARRFAQLVTEEDPSAVCDDSAEMVWRIRRGGNGGWFAEFGINQCDGGIHSFLIYESHRFKTQAEAMQFIKDAASV